MKTTVLSLVIIGSILSLQSCFLTLDAQGKLSNSTVNNYITNVHGNGNVLSFDRTISPYANLVVDGPFDIQTDRTLKNDQIRLECDENLANYIETTVKGETLEIKAKENIHFQDMTKLKVFVPK